MPSFENSLPSHYGQLEFSTRLLVKRKIIDIIIGEMLFDNGDEADSSKKEDDEAESAIVEGDANYAYLHQEAGMGNTRIRR
ncbi:hypothetical protein PsorP6_012917 [Peronosclerospora sorghi]|uniref:Uncharacterized protein n=1 Tax=Peronosclerospora sorghi TaxID=230839 RepID=A0ACC0WEC0_9STRA|nr:hypothetical protein PsorP6_012917 [Peronosclerospora sorghi]